MKFARLAAVLVALPALTSAALYTPRQPLSIGDVVELSKSGVEPPSIIQRIRESSTTYALRGSDFAKLQADGVADAVLDYLQQTLVDGLDLSTRYWVGGEGLGACSFCFPQPVNIDELESGYGLVFAPSLGRYEPGKPAGTPPWVPYPPAVPFAGQISVANIEEMARDGVPEAQIIDRINHSRLTHVIGVGGSHAVRTQVVAGLSGSELARLYGRGVAFPVLDALQGQFLAQFIEADRLRYQNRGKKR